MRSGFHLSAIDFLRMRVLSLASVASACRFLSSHCADKVQRLRSSDPFKLHSLFPDSMKETAGKRRDKAGGRDRDSKSDKSKEPKEAKDAAPEPQDVEMPEEDAANTAKQPKELDSLTLEGKVG